VVEQSPIAVVLMNSTGIINYVNPAFIKLTEYNSEDIIGELLETIGVEEITKEEHELILKDTLNGEIREKVFKNRKKSGEIFYATSRITRYQDSSGDMNGLITMMIDITQSVQDQIQIKNDLIEKELLLQEIYHRVNNNMQIMISLLNMQVARAVLDGEKNVLIIAQSRVGAISAIHNNIYQEHSFIAINFGNVTGHIFNNLCDSLKVLSGNIELKVEAEVPYFGLDLAQPCALIVNELISNSMRHAYPDGKGTISVKLTIDELEVLTLIVKDNGVGIPESIDPETSDTTGFSLVYMLAISQLAGTVNIKRNNGTTVTIKFKRFEDQKRF
jgi:PAS domain S-box-containing protein